MLATLIIENNVTSRESLKQLLSARYPHVKTQVAANGRQALQAVKNKVPDVVLMNIRLPGLKGFEVLREIRSRSGRVIIVVLADDDTPEYRDAAFSCGADFYISMWSSSSEEINSLLDTILLLAQAMADEAYHPSR